jgi:hypothetical protein
VEVNLPRGTLCRKAVVYVADLIARRPANSDPAGVQLLLRLAKGCIARLIRSEWPRIRHQEANASDPHKVAPFGAALRGGHDPALLGRLSL